MGAPLFLPAFRRSSFSVFLAGLMLTACSVTVDQISPAVSQFNGDSVSMQLNGNLYDLASADVKSNALAAADQEATRICQKGHKKRAEYTSTRTIPTSQYGYVAERLYLCLN